MAAVQAAENHGQKTIVEQILVPEEEHDCESHREIFD